MPDSKATSRREQVRAAQAAFKEKMRAGGYSQRTVWVNSDDLVNLAILRSYVKSALDRPDLVEFIMKLEAQLDFGKPGRPSKKSPE